MCMFCAAIPATLAVGAANRQKQYLAKQKEEEDGKPVTKPVIPAGPATAVIVAGLAVASVIYHTHVVGI
jgi:hypothetical protein